MIYLQKTVGLLESKVTLYLLCGRQTLVEKSSSDIVNEGNKECSSFSYRAAHTCNIIRTCIALSNVIEYSEGAVCDEEGNYVVRPYLTYIMVGGEQKNDELYYVVMSFDKFDELFNQYRLGNQADDSVWAQAAAPYVKMVENRIKQGKAAFANGEIIGI